MDYTHNFHQTFLNDEKSPEHSAETLGTHNPHTVFLNQVLIEYLRELSVYIIKLKKLGITNEKIKEDIIEATSMGILNVEYNEQQFFEIISKLFTEMLNAKELYINVCKRNNIKFKLLKSSLKTPTKLTFSELVLLGQKIFNLKYTNFDIDQMSLIELYMNIIRSLCVNLVQLRMFGYDDDEVFDSLLLTFALKSSFMPFIQNFLSKRVNIMAGLNNKLLRRIHEIKREKYGEIEPTEVSMTTKAGKAILVAGMNLKDLELLLESTKDKGIDVYTYGYMLQAHLYPKFKAYPHLVGHIGMDVANYAMDFLEFPGAILLTKHSFFNVEKLYQCRIYTTDPMAIKGVGLIKNNNFEPLIEAAMHAEGFEETTYHPPLNLNLSEKIILEKINEIAQKIESGEIKRFFVIGIPNNTKTQEDYFKKFLNLLGEENFVISMSYHKDSDNFFLIHGGHSYPLFYNILDVLTKNINISELDPVVLITRCEMHSFANVLYMKQLGIKKIYFTDCSPALINPALTSFVKKTFDVKDYTHPERDLKEMLSKDE